MNLPVFRRAGENGFTLLEVLISLAILSGVIVTIITVMNSHIAASGRLSERAFAALLARQGVEEALLSGAREGRRTEAAGLQGYRIDYSSEEAEAGLEKICAEVSWGKDEKVAVCAYTAKNN